MYIINIINNTYNTIHIYTHICNTYNICIANYKYNKLTHQTGENRSQKHSIFWLFCQCSDY